MIKSLKKTPKNWTIVKIPEVLFFQEGPGVRKWQFTSSGIKLLNVGNINNGEIDLTKTKVHLSSEEANGKYKHFLIDEGDLLIACSGIVVSNFYNKIAFIKKEHLPLCLNTSTMRFKVLDDTKISIKYFKYYLQTILFTSQLRKLITGSAQLNFGPSHVKQIDLLLPPLATQKKIATILDEADKLRNFNKALLQKYEQLTQSLFLEMFGDPVLNPMGWEKKELSEFGKISSGSTPSRKIDKYYKGNIPWVKTGEVNSTIIIKTEENITQEAIDNSSCKLYKKNSILIAMYGQGKTRGQVGILGVDATTNQACAVIPPSEKINHNYLYHLLQLSYKNLRSLGRGGNQPNLNLGLINNYKIILPPIQLQNEFASRIKIIETQKEQAQKALEQSNNLFNSLLQKAFKGELV